MPGAGEYVFKAQQLPDELEETSNNFSKSNPIFYANVKASQTPIIDIPKIILLHILAA